jgi:hypothetical protein
MLASRSIKVFDTVNSCFISTITEEEFTSSAIVLPNANIAICSWSGTLIVYNLNKGLNCIKRINLQEYDCLNFFRKSWKMILIVDDSKVVCSALFEVDYHIVLLENNSNEFGNANRQVLNIKAPLHQ